MGISSSTLTGKEGEHFAQLINPTKYKPEGSSPSKSEKNEKQEVILKSLGIDPRARVIKKVDSNVLWDKFISSAFNSFALTPTEMESLLQDTLIYSQENPLSSSSANASTNEATQAKKKNQAAIEVEIKDLINLILELSEKDTSKTIDFMSICSASLLLNSNLIIEMKIDVLFQWIKLNPETNEFSFEDFIVSLFSFERGVSHCLGKQSCSENFIKEIASQWISLADPQHRHDLNQIKISQGQFLDFCLNRQHIIRKLLEIFSSLNVYVNTNLELSEVGMGNVASSKNNLDDLLKKEPKGGDEWMANPAWRKTAEKMIPKSYLEKRKQNIKPSCNLELDWVHGYRGFDCRNNLLVVSANPSTTFLLYHTAALAIALQQNIDNPKKKKQYFFNEHGDDIISFAYTKIDSNKYLIASGEIGKTPAIYLYTWTFDSSSPSGSFQSLLCIKGFHSKGVSQLCFSKDGKMLFSANLEYSIGLYNTDLSNMNTFGKMILSSQGPKEKILHVSYQGDDSTASNGEYQFITCGEKHIITWNYQKKKNQLTQENNKLLQNNKNKFYLSVIPSISGTNLLSTSDGELYSWVNKSIYPVTLTNYSGHNKSSINALWSNSDGNVIISGDKDGKLIVWNAQLINNTKAGTQVLGLEPVFEYIVTNDVYGDKNVILEGQNSKSLPLSIRSISLSTDERILYVGTQSCEIIEYLISTPNVKFTSLGTLKTGSKLIDPSSLNLTANVRVYGHSSGEVWGLTVRPKEKNAPNSSIIYASIGDDGYLKIWSLEDHSLLYNIGFNSVARTCAFSPDGLYIAIGFGSGNNKMPTKKGQKNKDEGLVRILRIEPNPSDLTDLKFTQIAEIKEFKQWISVVKFSPDGLTLGVGSRENAIFLYSVPNQFKRKVKFSKHNAGILCFDFSMDSKFIQSCCSAYEILFFDAQTGAQITDASTKLIDVEWHTWTCTLGWSVIGIWSGTMDGSDVNSTDRSISGKYIATADDFGKVNIFTFPALQEKGSTYNSYTGHSSHVTNVKWISKSSNSDDYLISLGGEDKCVFQWKFVDSQNKDIMISSNENDIVDTQDVELDVLIPSGGDEFMAVKPWLGAIFPPSNYSQTVDNKKLPSYFAALNEFCTQHQQLQLFHDGNEGKPEKQKDLPDSLLNSYKELSLAAENVSNKLQEAGYFDPSPPINDDLELDWVYGYRGFDCRNNLYYLPLGNSKTPFKRLLIYHSASLGIVYDPVEQEQKYFRGHTDDIISMTLSYTDQGAIVATGQEGIGKLYIWEVPSMQTKAVIENKQKSIYMLRFSSMHTEGNSTANRLLIALSQDYLLNIYDWKSQTCLVSTKTDNSFSLDMSILQSTFSLNNVLSFITVGNKQMKLNILQGRNLISNKLVISGCKDTKLQNFWSSISLNNHFFIGNEDGSIYVIPHVIKSQEDIPQIKGVKFQFSHALEIEKSGGTKNSKDSKKSLNNAITSLASFVVRDISGQIIKFYLISAAKDGSIVVWDITSFETTQKAKFEFSFFISQFENIYVPSIQSIRVLNENKIFESDLETLIFVIGTKSCDILEIKCNLIGKSVELFLDGGKSKGLLVRGHYHDELWGLATHPFLPMFCTTGDDKTLRFYHFHSHELLTCCSLGYISRTIDYHPSGKYLALGFGGRVGKGKEVGGGIVRVYEILSNPSTLITKDTVINKIVEKQDAKQWISDIKFSPNGNTIVAGAHDCKIYIYNFQVKSSGGQNTYELQLKNIFNKHNSVINHFDISLDNRYIQSNCSAYELLFSDLTSGKQITKASELKDVKWSTWTCTLGWPVQGIWSGNMDGTDINAVSRSHSGHLLATSDDFGKVNLFRYPVCDPKQSKAVIYGGHSSHVMNVRWSVADEFLISVGGNDKSVFQWKHVVSNSGSSTGQERNNDIDSHDVGLLDSKDTSNMLDNLLSGESLSGGDESGAVKPWLGAIRGPSNPPPISNNPPAIDCKLSWVHGYNCSPTYYHHHNVFFNSNAEIIYPAAALGVRLSYNRNSEDTLKKSSSSISEGGKLPRGDWKQSFYQGHSDDILCLTMSSDRRYIATGQIASKSLKGKASVCIWDALEAGRLLTTIEGCHARGVISLSFDWHNDVNGNPTSQLVTIGMDDSFTHNLYRDTGGNWSKVQLIASTRGDKIPPQFVQWNHYKNELFQKNDLHFVSGGNKLINLWKIEGSNLIKKQARMNSKKSGNSSQSFFSCVTSTWVKDDITLVFGNNSGDIYYLNSQKELTSLLERAHNSSITALASNLSYQIIISGDKSGGVKLWNHTMQLITQFTLDSSSTSIQDLYSTSIVALDIMPLLLQQQVTFVAGTSGGSLIEAIIPTNNKISLPNTSSLAVSPDNLLDIGRGLEVSKLQLSSLVSSHYGGELWGLAAHPIDSDLYATVGDDSILRVWSIKRNQCISSIKLPRKARLVSWHPFANLLAVGFYSELKRGSKKSAKTSKKSQEPAKKSTKTDEEDVFEQDISEMESQFNSKNTDQLKSPDYQAENYGALIFSYRYIPANASMPSSNPTFELFPRVRVGNSMNLGGKDSSFPSVTEMKFSPLGNFIFLGTQDHKILGYTLPQVKQGDVNNSDFPWDDWKTQLFDEKPQFIFNKHSSHIIHLDCTIDESFLQSNDIGNELLFYNLQLFKQETSLAKVAEYNNSVFSSSDDSETSKVWASQTCKFGWSVQGIWPANAYDSSDINAVDRHPNCKYLATAEDSGNVRLLRFPSVTPSSQSICLSGHSSHVTNVRWTISNGLISVGGNDKSVFVWNFNEK